MLDAHNLTPPNVKCIALDFDGVIVDSMPPQEVIWRRVARSVLDDQQEHKLILNLYAGKARDRMFDGILLTDEQRYILRREKNQIWHEQRENIPLVDGAKGLIPILRKRYPIAITTTAEVEYVNHILQRENLAPYVDLILTDDDVRRGKPYPDMIFEVSSRLKVPQHYICLIGDTITDLEMSRRAGCKFILMSSKEIGVELPAGYQRVSGWIELAVVLRLDAAAVQDVPVP